MMATDTDLSTAPRTTAVALPGKGITVLVASSGFTESLGPRQAAAAIEAGIQAESPASRVLQVPVIDGGAGFVEEVVRACSGTIELLRTADPYGGVMTTRLGLIGHASNLTGVIGIEEAKDLRRLPPDRRDPTRASSRGVGQLINAAVERGVRRIVIGCSGSGANDGGIGMATELGVRFFDASRTEIVEAGGLQRLAGIDLSKLDWRLRNISIEAVVNPLDDLLGDRGVTHVLGPLRGASPSQVRCLERGLCRYAEVIKSMLGVDVASLAGGGASGGLGAGLAVFAGARLITTLEFLQNRLDLDSSFQAADLAMTAADVVNGFTPAGEVPHWVVRKARALGLPVIALARVAAKPLAANVRSSEDLESSPVIPPAAGGRDELPARTVEWLSSVSARAMRAALDRLARGAGVSVLGAASGK